MVDVEKIWANGVAAANECDGEDACMCMEAPSVCGAGLRFRYCQHQACLCVPPAGMLLCACWVYTRLCAASVWFCACMCAWLGVYMSYYWLECIHLVPGLGLNVWLSVYVCGLVSDV